MNPILRNLLLLAMAWAAAGCATSPRSALDSSPFVYPGSYFERERDTSFLEEMAALGVTREQYWEVMQHLESRKQFDSEMSDPFICQRAPNVEYGSPDPAKQIAAFYQTAFRSNGWQEVRRDLKVECADGKHDWLRVFRKGEQRVLVRIHGPWEKIEQDKPPETFAVRDVTLKFLGIKPEEFLGKDYKLKKHPWFKPPAVN